MSLLHITYFRYGTEKVPWVILIEVKQSLYKTKALKPKIVSYASSLGCDRYRNQRFSSIISLEQYVWLSIGLNDESFEVQVCSEPVLFYNTIATVLVSLQIRKCLLYFLEAFYITQICVTWISFT